VRRNAREGGWALISVLWGLVIISLVADMMLSSARVSYRQAAYDVEEAQRQAAADAATVRAVLGLLDARPDHRWRIDGVPQTWAFDGQEMRVAVEDEGGKIDMNASGDAAIRQLLTVAAGAGDTADKILDWRDQKGDAHRLHGATAADYGAAGMDYFPRGGMFQSVDELKLVLGIDPAVFERIRPAVTVFSGRSKVNLATAPEAVLEAVGGQNAATAAQTIAARQLGAATDQSQGQAIVGGVVASGIPIDGWAFSVAIVSPDGRHLSDRVIRLTPKSSVPFLIQDLGIDARTW